MLHLIGDTGIPGLRHFLYKSRVNVQFTMPELTEPYATTSARKRLLRQYQNMNERMHRKTRPLKLLFHVGEQETMLGWVILSFLSILFTAVIFFIVIASNHIMFFSSRW